MERSIGLLAAAKEILAGSNSDADLIIADSLEAFLARRRDVYLTFQQCLHETNTPKRGPYGDVRVNLELIRVKLGLTSQEFAELIEVKASTYGNWRRMRTQPSANKIADIAGILGLSVSALFRNLPLNGDGDSK